MSSLNLVLVIIVSIWIALLLFTIANRLWIANRKRLFQALHQWNLLRSQKKDKRRLHRMEKVLQLKLTDLQRKTILCPLKPWMKTWPRRSGKTICAVLWMMIHDSNPVTRRFFHQHYFDPDIYKSGVEDRQILSGMSCHVDQRRADWAWENMLNIYHKLVNAGIRVNFEPQEEAQPEGDAIK